jgi:DNA-binding LacI/PurR family transcriptional regulator
VGEALEGRRSRRTATLASLAAELGVSRTTVSNAYNRPDQLSPALRRRVLDTARRLGYPGPDPVARSLRTRKAGAVGLLLTEALSYAFRDPVAVQFLEGLGWPARTTAPACCSCR